MANILLILLFSSFWVFGVHVMFTEDHIFEKIGVWADENLSPYIVKPLIGCPMCMGSAHGSIIYFWFLFGSYSWFGWIPFCVCLCGLNYIINNLFRE